jgi:hypothetical protein
MKNNKILEGAAAAGIAVFFSGSFIICYNLVHQIINFIISLPVTGINH